MKRVDVRRLLTFCIWGSGNVIHISDTSPASKKEAISSMLVRRNATLAMPSCTDCLAPVHTGYSGRAYVVRCVSGGNEKIIKISRQ